MKITCKKLFGALYPVEEDQDAFEALKNGEYSVTIAKQRNLQFHRKYFALINKVFKNQEVYKTEEDLRHALMIETGYFKKCYTLKGDLIELPESIAFHKMDEVEFTDLYNKTLDVIFKYLIKGTPEDEHRFIEQLRSF